MAPDVPVEAVEEFALGIRSRNLTLVKEALDAGVAPTTDVYGRHPLWVLLGTDYEELPDGLQTGMTRDEFRERTSEIVATLFDHGVKVAEEGKYQTSTQAYLADRFVLSDDVNDAATIVIHAIHETLQDGRSPYTVEPKDVISGIFMRGAAGPNPDVPDVANHITDDIMHLHETVRERLQNPQTDIEKSVAAAGDAVQHWVQPMQRPDVGRIITDLRLVRPANEGSSGELAETFQSEAQQTPDFVYQLEVKPPRQVLDEMNEELIGLTSEKKSAQRLAFRQSYDKARAGENLAPLPAQSFNTAYVGGTGIGKSTFAHKQAELLVALGLAGPNIVEITRENHGKMAGSYTPKLMTQYFIDADIVSLELTGSKYYKDGKNVDDYIFDALQASLDARKKPLVVFLSGQPEDVEAALDNCPGVKALIKNFVTIPDPSIDQLGQALVNRLAHPLKDGVPQKDVQGLVIDEAALDYVKQEFIAARKRFGKDFRNMREVDAVAEKLPDAIAERLFGSNENEQALTSAPDRKAVLNIVTLDDVKAINLRKMLGGENLLKAPGIGFTANL